MPDKLVTRLARKKNITLEKSENLWQQANNIAEENGHSNEHDYITAIFKKMLGEKLTFKDFLILVEEGEPTNTSGGTMPDHKASDGKPKKKKKKKKTFSNINKNRNEEIDNDPDLDTEKDDDYVPAEKESDEVEDDEESDKKKKDTRSDDEIATVN